MKKSSEATTRLHVRAGDNLTEISIFDNQFRRLASGLGSLSKNLAPGIYKVRWKTSTTAKDKLVEISGREEGGVLNLAGEELAIKTSAPLASSTLGLIDRPNLLENLTANPPELHPDKSSELLIFLRDEKGVGKTFPVQSISIHDPSGTMLANFADGIVDENARLAGLNIGLDPGVYRLRVETGPLGTYEIFVPTSKGWQTRVFLACDNFYSGEVKFRRPQLRTASILMGRQRSRFYPESRDARLAEIALTALLRGYDILDSGDMQDILHGKFDDPMLGIYGAHLILSRPRIKWGLFDTVCRNLHNLVGPIPDVQALSVRARKPMPVDDKMTIYNGLPPMLISSWDLLVKRSRSRYKTIPLGSLADRISGKVVSTKPWLMCRVESATEVRMEAAPDISFAKANRVLTMMVKQVADAGQQEIKSYLLEQGESLNPLESAILGVLTTAEKAERKKDKGVAIEVEVPLKKALSDDPEGIARQVLSKLSAPSYSIARSTATLAEKLKGKFDFDSMFEQDEK